MVPKYYVQLPPEFKVSKNLNETLNRFTADLIKKRKAVKPQNFRNQALKYLEQLDTGDTNQPAVKACRAASEEEVWWRNNHGCGYCSLLHK